MISSKELENRRIAIIDNLRRMDATIRNLSVSIERARGSLALIDELITEVEANERAGKNLRGDNGGSVGGAVTDISDRDKKVS